MIGAQILIECLKREGVEVIDLFLKAAGSHLNPAGSILFLYSSETGIKPKEYRYNFEILEERTLFFETLYCVKLNPI